MICIVKTREYYKVEEVIPLRYRQDISISSAPSSGIPSTTSVNISELAPSPRELLWLEGIGIDGGYYPYDSDQKGAYIQINYPVGHGRFGPKGPVNIRQIDAPKNNPFKIRMMCRQNNYPGIVAYNYLDKDVTMEVWFYGEKLKVEKITEEDFNSASEEKKRWVYG